MKTTHKAKTPKKKKRRSSPLPSTSTVEGTIHVHPKGFAFVSPDDATSPPQDIFIPKHLKGNAVDGDRVEVALRPARRPEKGPEGVVKTILERGKKEVVGVIWMVNPQGHYVLYLPSLGSDHAALLKKTDHLPHYKLGDRLLLAIKKWGTGKRAIECDVIKKIGSIAEPSSDLETATLDFHIRTLLPDQVVREARAFSPTVSSPDLQGRRDLTSLETVTIDPDTARDFDDALSLTQDEQGRYHLGIHIADVTHYVKEGSAIDREAKERCNSVYFPGKCIPMLPECLSNHLCSLIENEIRLTVSVLTTLDKEGNVLDYELVRGYIRSRKRFTYGEAKRILDGKEPSPHLPLLKRMEQLCFLLKSKRTARGSVDFALPETVVLVDEAGAPYNYSIVDYDITHQMVEEFMLTANAIVATHCAEKKVPGIFRVHDAPDAESLEEFYAFARALGFSLPKAPSSKDLQRLFVDAKATPYTTQLAIGYIRSMKLAIYSHANSGHYGLALPHYCHFTSPIRRYSDLIVHRLLFSSEAGGDLAAIARTCSEKERNAAKAETAVIILKKLRWLKADSEQQTHPTYQATITKVKPFGFYFDVAPLSIEGFLHVSDLADDYYDYHPHVQALIGSRTGRSFRLGRSMTVCPTNIDLMTLETSWTLPPP